MASKNTQNTANGDVIIIKELAQHLNWSKEKTEIFIEESKDGVIAVETLLEKAISKVGIINRSNKDGEDFSDGTDAKKGVVTNNDTATGSKAVCISNIHNKNGDLRVMIGDPISEKNYYFIIPHHEIVGKNSIKIFFDHYFGGQPRKIQWNSFSGRCWTDYRVNTFIELCS